MAGGFLGAGLGHGVGRRAVVGAGETGILCPQAGGALFTLVEAPEKKRQQAQARPDRQEGVKAGNLGQTGGEKEHGYRNINSSPTRTVPDLVSLIRFTPNFTSVGSAAARRKVASVRRGSLPRSAVC